MEQDFHPFLVKPPPVPGVPGWKELTNRSHEEST
jgi:hypothetical protein